MPIYEFRCPKCRHPREIMLSVTTIDTPQVCLCGETMERKFSMPNIIMRETITDKVLWNVNKKHSRLDEGDKQAMYAGLGRNKPVMGTGF